MDTVFIHGLEARAVIGVNEWERRLRQRLTVDAEMAWDTATPGRSDELADALDYDAVASRIRTLIDASEFSLVEALAEALAADLRGRFGLSWLRLTVTKPGAVAGTRGVGVSIERGELRQP